MRTLVRDGDDMREFDFLEDALEFMGGVTLSRSTTQLLCETIEESSTVVLLPAPDAEPTPAEAGSFANQPTAHRAAVMLSGIALMHTFDSRNPVLAVNGGDVFLYIVSSPDPIEGYLTRYFGPRVPPLLPPPEDPLERWVVSLLPRGNQLLRTSVGMGFRPGIAQA